MATRRVTLLLAAMAAAMLMAMGVSLAETTPQGTLAVDNLKATLSPNFQFFLSNSPVGQTFTAPNSGKVSSAQVKLGLCSFGCTYTATQPVTIEITKADDSDTPTGDPLSSTEIPASEVNKRLNEGGSLVTGNFNDPVSVEAGQKYALLLKTADTTGNMTVALSENNPYDGGFALFQSPSDPHPWFKYPFDFIFGIYIQEEVLDVKSTNPTNDATEVEKETNPTVEFNSNLDPATVNGESVKLEVYNTKKQAWVPVTSTPSYDDTSKTITINPEETLGTKKQYRVTLSTAIESPTGKELASPYTWSFTAEK